MRMVTRVLSLTCVRVSCRVVVSPHAAVAHTVQ